MKNPEKLLDLLAQDARLTSAQLAAMLGESEEDVAAAIKAYEKNSTILGYNIQGERNRADRGQDHPAEGYGL